MINKTRLDVTCHYLLYQKMMDKTYNKKVCSREFEEEELVLKTIMPLLKENQSKQAPNYKDLHEVKQIFSGITLIRTITDGEDLSRPINFNLVKKYYV